MRYGEHFHKVTGSGNDFVAFDRLGQGMAAELPTAAVVRALCSRGEGVGADGVLVLVDEPGADYRLVYFNADGSRAELCGNASLCGVRLAVELGRAEPSGVSFVTDAGPMRGRIIDGLPEIDLTPPRDLSADRSDLWAAVGGAESGERRLGYVRVGVPHLVLLCDSAEAAELERRGPLLRRHPALGDGANVNFVSPAEDGAWTMRTFERGVEGETLACGTGSVATALVLTTWAMTGDAGAGARATEGPSGGPDGERSDGPAVPTVRIRTRSGRLHRVSLRGVAGDYRPSLAGEGR
ncbi:MAG: diaminopimelate epimerase, partial [Gemmatimonadaceae bacterium]